MKLVVAGAEGRMGRMLIRAVAETEGCILAGVLDREGSAVLGQDAGLLAGIGETGVKVSDDPLPLLAAAEGLLDFTAPAATVAYAALAAQARIVHVIGTTGLSAEDLRKIEAASYHARIVRSGNMSLGVNLLAGLARKVAATLGEEFDIEVLEMHHRMKVDAPSGTALLLGEAAAEGRGVALDERRVSTRDGHTGARRSGDIGFATLRGGSVIGDHSVIFAGPSERITLSHHAEDRAIFARGAVRAARWAFDKPPGLYGMDDVLGLA
ncbi:4-hydroxy-tetrahydrodipicolinate reductase [Methylobacterium organophilum]|uniref:4-hydroxy-tetrahydrodipicolinate reductase n=1 Tax=Methylobacterium organophilum TaxID=410 RepID=UPI001F14344F|nr:4-hydroxy-tetrahydrodipicolinate reductase [Methylobacterium organophilum]UMY15608.1 4-hydroxy-tetrahydrodipicolinate reductase [Methylobacterium organophilum]